MFNDRIVLTPQEILEKDFKVDTRGYRPQEVDKYLDIIIKDYVEFVKIIKEIESEKKDLIQENMNLKRELRNAKTNIEIVRNSEKEITNVDILRRIHNLKKLYMEKMNNILTNAAYFMYVEESPCSHNLR